MPNARDSVVFDLHLPDGQSASFRFTTWAVSELESRLNGTSVLQMLNAGQMTRATLLLTWAGRLHEEGWTERRAAACIDRYLRRCGRDLHEEALAALRKALGAAMVAAGEWEFNLLDPDAVRARADEFENVSEVGLGDDLEGVTKTGSDDDDDEAGDPPPAAPTR